MCQLKRVLWRQPCASMAHVFWSLLKCRQHTLFTLEWLICELQTISAAEYSTWRNATWQHTSKAEAVWRRGCDAIFRKNCNNKSKLQKFSRKQLVNARATPSLFKIGEDAEKCTCFYREKSASRRFHRPLQRGSMACHTTCFMRTHFMMTVLCSTMPDFPSPH